MFYISIMKEAMTKKEEINYSLIFDYSKRNCPNFGEKK